MKKLLAAVIVLALMLALSVAVFADIRGCLEVTVLALMLALTVTAFADIRGCLEWNGETRQWELKVYDDGDDTGYGTDPDELPL